ncbi:MAG: hypothetical protein K8R54_15265 [Bacteroidales bacterium]|nr:hypothetical protein [Bacteroidales bacterium]
MTKLIRNFIIKIIFLTVILGIISGAVFRFLLPDEYFDTFPFLLILFPLVSSVIHIQLLKASEKSLARFNIVFMLSFILKLLIYLAISATIISLEQDHKSSFVITILLFYLVYTVFDVKKILDDMKRLDIDKKS